MSPAHYGKSDQESARKFALVRHLRLKARFCRKADLTARLRKPLKRRRKRHFCSGVASHCKNPEQASRINPIRAYRNESGCQTRGLGYRTGFWRKLEEVMQTNQEDSFLCFWAWRRDRRRAQKHFSLKSVYYLLRKPLMPRTKTNAKRLRPAVTAKSAGKPKRSTNPPPNPLSNNTTPSSVLA